MLFLNRLIIGNQSIDYRLIIGSQSMAVSQSIDYRLLLLSKSSPGPLRQATGPPRAGAGVGVGMLRGAGDSPHLKIETFKVSWFLGFLVSWFFVSGFLDSKIYQISISCFLEDICPISKLIEILSTGSSSFFGAHLFQN